MRIVFFFVTMIVFFGGRKGKCVWKKGDMHGRAGMYGRAWTGVVIKGRIGLGGWEEGKVVILFMLLYLSSVS